MNKIKFNIISLLVAPIPFIFLDILFSFFNYNLVSAKFLVTINIFLIYLVELIIALPLLLFIKKNLSYNKTVLFGMFIGLFSAFILKLITNIGNWTIGLTDILFTNLKAYLAGIIVGFLVSSYFWIINNFLNKRYKQHVD